MRYTTLLIVCTCLLSPFAMAHETTVNPLLQIDLGDLQKQEGLMVEVALAPGDPGVPHRHNAHTFVYVLEGSVVMQVKGGEEKTLTTGQTFYETPDDVHVVGRNASNTEPARILVFFVKKQGAPATVPSE
jgi:quercetin dioxygenase-like cupin family protein